MTSKRLGELLQFIREADPVGDLANRLIVEYGPAAAEGEVAKLVQTARAGNSPEGVALRNKVRDSLQEMGLHPTVQSFPHLAAKAGGTKPAKKPKPKLSEGWAKPGLSKAFHYFVEGRSLCGRWAYTGRLDPDDQFEQATDTDCKACRKTLAKREEKKA